MEDGGKNSESRGRALKPWEYFWELEFPSSGQRYAPAGVLGRGTGTPPPPPPTSPISNQIFYKEKKETP